MKKSNLLFLFLFLQTSLWAQFPDFTATDIDGVEYSLYDDYLNQGKMVIIEITATWAGPCWQFSQTSGLDDFYQESAGAAMVLAIEADEATTVDDIRGIGGNTVGDYTANTSYPIINADQGLINLFDIQYFPAVVMICPNGEAFSSYDGTNFTEIPDMGWGEFINANIILDKGLTICDWTPYGQLILGDVFRDGNTNCEDDTEPRMPNVYFEISNGSHTYHRYTNDDGQFKIGAQTNVNYTINAIPPSGVWEFCEDTKDVFFDGSVDTMGVQFAIQSLTDCPIPQVDISSPLLWRCFESKVYVKACNAGTIPLEDAQLTVNLDQFLVPIGFSIPPSSSNGNVYIFDISLDALECENLVIDVEVDCEVELGYEHCYTAHLTGSNLCPNSPGAIEIDRECRENQGSYDPNDKRNFPMGEGEEHFVLANTDIEYHIRFQNTGTFYAKDVVIVDTLSNVFDLSTLRLGSSSHPYEFEITEERTLKFIFNDILLPDSTTDLEGSQGFVSFHLQQVSDLPDGTLLENEAAIYFDFNDPIITNRTLLTIGELTNTDERLINNLAFSAQPNPASDFIKISILEEGWTNGEVQLFHVSGQLMDTQKINAVTGKMDVSNLATGVYMLRLESEDGKQGVQKIVIK